MYFTKCYVSLSNTYFPQILGQMIVACMWSSIWKQILNMIGVAIQGNIAYWIIPCLFVEYNSQLVCILLLFINNTEHGRRAVKKDMWFMEEW